MTRLRVGHIAVFQQVVRKRQLAEEQDIYQIGQSTDCSCNPMRINGHANRIQPFLGKRRGHEATVDLPRGKIRLKLVEVREIVPDDHA